MGNPASVKRKKSEKRRKKYEARLGPGAYLPKEHRLALNTELEKLAAAEKIRMEGVKKAAEAKKNEKEKKKAKPPAAEKPTAKDEKGKEGKEKKDAKE